MKNLIKKLFTFEVPSQRENFVITDREESVKYDVRFEDFEKKEDLVSKDYEFNLNYIKKRFSYPQNNDVVIRNIKLKGDIRAFLVFYDGMVDTQAVDLAVVETLQKLPLLSKDKIDLDFEYIMENLVSHSQISAKKEFEKIIDEVNFGSCGLFVEGVDKGFAIDVRKWGTRGIDKPENEQSIYGPQEAFGEMIRTNSALVRKIIKNEKLICKGIQVGKVSKTRGVLMYISDIANDELVSEVERRINGIEIDYVVAVEEVSQLIEEESLMITNHILGTERPDRVARALSEGRVALILNGSPRALIFPTNAFELMHTAADAYMRSPYANMTRIIRMLALFVSLLLPSIYLAITLFHQEMVPTFLIFAISAARENVPFPSIVELLLMDFSFEMIREAGIRMPGPIGSTLGIVGGLILGQAAVSAKIVSPIMIIIIALTGIGSFAITDYSLGWSYRILRIIFIVLASICGFYGVAIGLFVYAVILGGQTSFGVPFLAPLAKGKRGSVTNSVFVSPIWKREKRPDFLSTKDNKNEPKISEKWKLNKKK